MSINYALNETIKNRQAVWWGGSPNEQWRTLGRLKNNVGEIQLGKRKGGNLKPRRFICTHTQNRVCFWGRRVWEASFSLKRICSKLNKLSTIKRYNHLQTRRQSMENVSAHVHVRRQRNRKFMFERELHSNQGLKWLCDVCAYLNQSWITWLQLHLFYTW